MIGTLPGCQLLGTVLVQLQPNSVLESKVTLEDGSIEIKHNEEIFLCIKIGTMGVDKPFILCFKLKPVVLRKQAYAL